MSIKGASKAKTADVTNNPLLDDLPATFPEEQVASASASADAADEGRDLRDEFSSSSSADQSPAESGAEEEDQDEEVEASQKSEPEVEHEEVSSDAEEVAAVTVAATNVVPTPTPTPVSTSVQSFGKVVVRIAKTVEPDIAAKAVADQKEIDTKNAKAAEDAAALAIVEAARKPDSEKASDQKLQDAKDTHKDQAAAETKARLEAYHLIPAKTAALATEAKQVADVKLPHIQAEAEKVLAAESVANQAAQTAAEVNKKVDQEKAKTAAGKVVKRVEVAQPTMAESVGKLPPKLAAKFAETLAAAQKAGEATKVTVGTDEHAKESTKSLVNLFETKNSQASETAATATAKAAPTHSIGKVANKL